jgi:hypothetical protein
MSLPLLQTHLTLLRKPVSGIMCFHCRFPCFRLTLHYYETQSPGCSVSNVAFPASDSPYLITKASFRDNVLPLSLSLLQTHLTLLRNSIFGMFCFQRRFPCFRLTLPYYESQFPGYVLPLSLLLLPTHLTLLRYPIFGITCFSIRNSLYCTFLSDSFISLWHPMPTYICE